MRLIDADALKEQIENFNCKDCNHYNFVRCRACQIDDALTYIDEAPTIGGWISVEDRLPENSDTVLITHKGGVSFGWYNGRYWERGASTKHREIRTVFHWMPLPEPPKEVKQDG